MAFSIIKAAKILNIQIKYNNMNNIQSSNIGTEELPIYPKEKGLDFNESKLLAEIHKQTRYPIDNFSKNLIKVSEIESSDSISNETINILQENIL